MWGGVGQILTIIASQMFPAPLREQGPEVFQHAMISAAPKQLLGKG